MHFPMSHAPRLLLFALLTAWAGLRAAEPLKSTDAVRALPLEKAREHPPVSLDAVITFYHDDWGVLFVHDGRSGICVGLPPEKRPAQPFTKGTRVRVEGIVSEGEFLPVDA